MTLEDISGNSFLENPLAPEPDPAMTVELFVRTKLQDAKLGLAPVDENENPSEPNVEEEEKESEKKDGKYIFLLTSTISWNEIQVFNPLCICSGFLFGT